MQEKSIFVGLDIGTSKVACIVAEISSGKRLTAIGVGDNKSLPLHYKIPRCTHSRGIKVTSPLLPFQIQN